MTSLGVAWLEAHWLDVIGWGGSALLIISLLQARVLRLRVMNLIGSALLTGFNAVLHVWPMVALNGVSALINVWFIVQLLGQRHDEQTFDVLEVGPDDAYLRHVLRVHGADILHFQPDFVWDHADERGHAFVIVRGDETVGLVLLQADGDTARLKLDYVTPHYRDFSPGEFVWRRSGALREAGFRRVVTPPGMVDAYYDRVGFRHDQDAWVLDL